jgi:N-acyl-L-homoserine lactone synthetase
MTRYGVILFHTNSSVMRAEKLLKRAGYSIKIIPTPREFSSDCGVALRFDWTDCEQVKVILDTAHLEIDAIHQM